MIGAELARTLEDETGGSALGRAVTVGDRSYDVAAVMGDDFAFPSADVDVWLIAPAGSGAYRLVGRLLEGTTIAGAGDDATRVAREIDGEAWSAVVRSVEETLLGSVRPVIRVSIAAALLLLVVACANTVTLLIGRSVVRSREFAVRIALGSGMARLVRAALVEGLSLAAGGLLAGLAAAWVGLRLFTATAAGAIPRLDGVAFDVPVILTGLVLTLLVGVACGAASAFTATGFDAAILRCGAAATGAPATRRLRGGLAAAQIALSIVLLTGAGLLVRTVDRLLAEESGFEPDRALTARLMLADRMFIDGGAATAFVDTLLERVRVLPGVQAAGVGSLLPPDEAPLMVSMRFESANRSEYATLSFGTITAGYLEALGTPLKGGRRFAAADDHAAVSPVMLSETAARFVYPDREVHGLRLRRPRHRTRRITGRWGRQRREAPGPRRAADGFDVRPVAACADRGGASRRADRRRSGGAGARGSRPHSYSEPVASGSGGTHARRPCRGFHRGPSVAGGAGGRVRGAGAGRRHRRSLRNPGPGRSVIPARRAARLDAMSALRPPSRPATSSGHGDRVDCLPTRRSRPPRGGSFHAPCRAAR